MQAARQRPRGKPRGVMTECALLERNPCRWATSRLGTRSDHAMIVHPVRQARGVVVAVMSMGLRCDSDEMIGGQCVPGAPSLRLLTRNVNIEAELDRISPRSELECGTP